MNDSSSKTKDALSEWELLEKEGVPEHIEKYGVSGLEEFFRAKLEKWKDVEINIGVTGDSGAGKSSFINVIRGYVIMNICDLIWNIYIYIYIYIYICFVYETQRVLNTIKTGQIEFRLPQNSATVCFICKDSSGGMTSFKNRGLLICVLPKRGSGCVNKACIQSIVCVVYAEIPNQNVGVCGLLSIVCVVNVYAKFLPMSARRYNFHSFIE
jgi:hypothetical protein